MLNGTMIYFIICVVGGASVAAQSAINSELGRNLKNPIYSSVTSFTIGLLAIICYLLITKQPIPDIELYKSAPKWSYLGGILGAIFLTTTIISTAKLGAASATATVLVAQLTMALCIDHFGLFNASVHLMSVGRIIGFVFLLVGVLFINFS